MVMYGSVHNKTAHGNAIDQKPSLFLSLFLWVTDLSEYIFRILRTLSMFEPVLTSTVYI